MAGTQYSEIHDDQGDLTHPLFADEMNSELAELPADVGDGPYAASHAIQVATASAASKATGAVSGLNARQRAKARELTMQGAYLGFKNAPDLHYTQGPKRWQGIDDNLRAWKGQCPNWADCSAFATWCLWQGLWHFHVRDVVNGAAWKAGYTGTMLSHGKVVVHERNIKHGDLALYGSAGSTGKHVAICVGGGKVISHGSEGGPYLLPIRYRSDLLDVRRYI